MSPVDDLRTRAQAAGFSEAAVEACVSFLEIGGVADLATREGAKGKCFLVSSDFAVWLSAAGIEYRWVRACGPHITTYLEPHELAHIDTVDQNAIEIEGRAVIDWTWRMWEPEHPEFPRITPLAEWLSDFARLDADCCPACGYEHTLDRDQHDGAIARADELAEGLRSGRIVLGTSSQVGLQEKADEMVRDLLATYGDDLVQRMADLHAAVAGGGKGARVSYLTRGRALDLLDRLRHPRGPRSLSYAIVAEHGRAFLKFEPIGEHELWDWGVCFHACFSILAAEERPGWAYVEGYALYALDANSKPYHHAWLATPEGHVFDPTWGNGGAAYIGVPMSFEWLVAERTRRNHETVFGSGDVRLPESEAIVELGVAVSELVREKRVSANANASVPGGPAR